MGTKPLPGRGRSWRRRDEAAVPCAGVHLWIPAEPLLETARCIKKTQLRHNWDNAFWQFMALCCHTNENIEPPSRAPRQADGGGRGARGSGALRFRFGAAPRRWGRRPHVRRLGAGPQPLGIPAAQLSTCAKPMPPGELKKTTELKGWPTPRGGGHVQMLGSLK